MASANPYDSTYDSARIEQDVIDPDDCKSSPFS
jgi:hypothetical protein